MLKKNSDWYCIQGVYSAQTCKNYNRMCKNDLWILIFFGWNISSSLERAGIADRVQCISACLLAKQTPSCHFWLANSLTPYRAYIDMGFVLVKLAGLFQYQPVFSCRKDSMDEEVLKLSVHYLIVPKYLSWIRLSDHAMKQWLQVEVGHIKSNLDLERFFSDNIPFYYFLFFIFFTLSASVSMASNVYLMSHSSCGESVLARWLPASPQFCETMSRSYTRYYIRLKRDVLLVDLRLWPITVTVFQDSFFSVMETFKANF